MTPNPPTISKAANDSRLYKKAPSTAFVRGDRVKIIDSKSRHKYKLATVTDVRGNVILAVNDNERAEHGYHEADLERA